MIISILFLIISYLLDGVFPCILKNFVPFFSISIIILINMLANDKKRCFIIIIIYGILYDLTYMPTFLLSSFSFCIIFLLSSFLTDKKYNMFIMIPFYFIAVNIFVFVNILITYFINKYNIDYVLNKIMSSLLINYLYFLLILFCTNLLKKTNNKHINELGDI